MLCNFGLLAGSGGECCRTIPQDAKNRHPDHCEPWFDNTNAPDPPRSFLAGAGLTLMWTPNPALSARLTWAENAYPVRVAGNRNLQDDGIHFSVTVRPTSLAR